MTQEESGDCSLHIWDETPAFVPFQNTFCAVLFHMNPLLIKEETHKNTTTVYEDITRRLRPWIEHYIWDKSAVSVELCEWNGYEYVYVELELGDTDTDEWLLTSVIWQMSETYQDLYARCWDSEGEHLLIESWEALPEWLEPETARNRAWINHKRVVLVPEVFYKDRGLRMEEALKFLEKAAYKCLRVIDIDKCVERKCKEFPGKALEGQVIMEVDVSRRVAGLLMKNKDCINPAVIDHLKELSIVEKAHEKDYPPVDDPVVLKVPTRVESYLMLDLWLKQKKPIVDFSKEAGRIADKAVLEYVKRHYVEELYTPLDREVLDFNDRGDLLQKELIRLMRIDEAVEPKLDFGPIGEDTATQEFDEHDMMKKLDQFFKDNDSGLDGVENKETGKKGFVKLEELNEEAQSDSEEDEEDDGDAKAREFLKSQNVDIDEDDFFEFFAKEALKMSDEDLEAFRNMTLKEKNDSDAEMAENDEEEDDDEGEEFMEQFQDQNMQESLKELLKSLQSGVDGPAATFFQNMK